MARPVAAEASVERICAGDSIRRALNYPARRRPRDGQEATQRTRHLLRSGLAPGFLPYLELFVNATDLRRYTRALRIQDEPSKGRASPDCREGQRTGALRDQLGICRMSLSCPLSRCWCRRQADAVVEPSGPQQPPTSRRGRGQPVFSGAGFCRALVGRSKRFVREAEVRWVRRRSPITSMPTCRSQAGRLASPATRRGPAARRTRRGWPSGSRPARP